MEKIKALCLFSGGLDSVLAMKLVKDQGIEVVAVNIDMGFGSTKNKIEHLKNMCEQIGVELVVLDLKEQYLDEVLFNPKYGYGKNFNPCIDCHGFMFRHTSKLLEKFNAHFLISGEVLEQRPMSQRKDALNSVAKLSGVADVVLRPLSAKLLPPTLPEIKGWIDRDKLLDISGRGRKRQLELAKKYNLKDIELPGGGCLLTEEVISKRLRDFIKYDKFEVEDIATLKHGRHFRVDNTKLIIGRNKEENDILKSLKVTKYIYARALDVPSPIALVSKNISDKQLIANIILSYTKASSGKVLIGNEEIEAIKLPKSEINKYLI